MDAQEIGQSSLSSPPPLSLFDKESQSSPPVDPTNDFSSPSTTIVASEVCSPSITTTSQRTTLNATHGSWFYSPPIAKQLPTARSPYSDLPIPVHTEFDASPEPVFLDGPPNYPSELPNVTSPTVDGRSPQVNKFKKFFRNFGSRQSKVQKHAAPIPRQRLPRSISFCFSASGRTLLLWKRNANTIITFDVLSCKASRISLDGVIPPMETDRRLDVRLVSAGDAWAAVIARHKQRLYLLLTFLRAGAQSFPQHPKPVMVPLPDNSNPIGMAMSPSDGLVTISFGRHLRVYACHTGAVIAEVELESVLPPAIPQKQKPQQREGVSYQAMGFCERGTRLVVATQDYNDDVVIYAWTCSSESVMYGELDKSREFLGSTRIITGYGDDRGVNTVLHSTVNSITFVAGFSGKRYPNIIIPADAPLSPGSQKSNTGKVSYLKSQTSQIHCAAISSSGSLVAIVDSRDNVSLIDLRASGYSIQHVGNISHERRKASPTERDVVMTMLDEDHVYVYFVADSQPVLIRFSLAGKKDVIDVGELSLEAIALGSP